MNTLNHEPTSAVHLQDYRKADGVALCGENGKTMSHHEIKRGRITCATCLTTYTPPVQSATFNQSQAAL